MKRYGFIEVGGGRFIKLRLAGGQEVWRFCIILTVSGSCAFGVDGCGGLGGAG